MHALLTLTLAALSFAPSQTAPTPLQRFAGQWTGAGTVNNMSVTAKAEFGAVLANRFTRLTYSFSLAGAGVIFEGHAYYACSSPAACRGNWFDSQGSTHILSATQTADALLSEWGDGSSAKGRTEYRLTSPDTLVVTDWVHLTSGEWRQFGRVEYQRQR